MTETQKKESGKPKEREILIPAPNFRTLNFHLVGTSPYVQHKFSQKAKEEMAAAHEAGSKTKKGKKREPRNFTSDYEAATHFSSEGWAGIPAAAFRNGLISACRIVGFAMTRGKLALFASQDGVDRDDATPLVRIEGQREPLQLHVRNDSGVVDLRNRPCWKEWTATVRVKYDADMFGDQDVTNLMIRLGEQVGIGEGRPDSKDSCGLGWGLFRVLPEVEGGRGK